MNAMEAITRLTKRNWLITSRSPEDNVRAITNDGWVELTRNTHTHTLTHSHTHVNFQFSSNLAPLFIWEINSFGYLFNRWLTELFTLVFFLFVCLFVCFIYWRRLEQSLMNSGNSSNPGVGLRLQVASPRTPSSSSGGAAGGTGSTCCEGGRPLVPDPLTGWLNGIPAVRMNWTGFMKN